MTPDKLTRPTWGQKGFLWKTESMLETNGYCNNWNTAEDVNTNPVILPNVRKPKMCALNGTHDWVQKSTISSKGKKRTQLHRQRIDQYQCTVQNTQQVCRMQRTHQTQSGDRHVDDWNEDNTTGQCVTEDINVMAIRIAHAYQDFVVQSNIGVGS